LNNLYAIKDPTENIRRFTTYGLRSKLINNEGCEKCGSFVDLQMHHINPRKNINKELSYFEKIPISIMRKQIVLCRNCHLDLHCRTSKTI
jgi:hypothetical protein